MAESQSRPKLAKLVEGFSTNIAIAVKIFLPIFDMVTDVYSLIRYFEPEKSFMKKVFYTSLVTILLHNIISGIHGVYNISRLNKQKKLHIWSGSRWKFVIIVLYAIGLGSIVCPIEFILAIKDNSLNYSER